MNIPVLIVIALLPATVGAQPRCPELPPGAPVHWEGHHGPHFDVCLALNTDGNVAFSVHRGNTPPLLADNLTRAEIGTVFGRPARWYEQGAERNYQAELFFDASPDNSVRVFVPRNPAGTFLERVEIVGALSAGRMGTP